MEPDSLICVSETSCMNLLSMGENPCAHVDQRPWYSHGHLQGCLPSRFWLAAIRNFVASGQLLEHRPLHGCMGAPLIVLALFSSCSSPQPLETGPSSRLQLGKPQERVLIVFSGCNGQRSKGLFLVRCRPRVHL